MLMRQRGLTPLPENRWKQDRNAFAIEALGFNPDPWQTRVLRGGYKRLLLLCARQTGKSTVAAILALHTALYAPPPALVLLVSPSLRQSAELFRKVRGFLDVMPAHPRLVEDNKLSLQFVTGGRVVSLPGAEKTARGFSAATLILEDEASRVPDEFNMAIRPMLAVGGGSLVLMSTPFGARGHFHDAYVNGNEEWKRVKVTGHDCPRITPEFLEEERRIIGDWWFKQEWLCEFVEALDSVFSFELIMKAMSDEVQPLFGGAFVG